MNGFSVKNENIDTPEELLKRGLPDSACAEYAFFASFDGMSISKLYDILCSLPGGNSLILNGKFNAFCGAKNALKDTDILLSELVIKKVSTVCVKGSFHPKIYLFKYNYMEKEDKKQAWRLIIGSKNITKDSYLDAFVMFQGNMTEKISNGNELYNIISSYFEYVDNMVSGVLEELKTVEFKLFSLPEGTKCENIRFVKPNKNILDNILTMNDGPVYIISPFVSAFKNYDIRKNVVLFSRKEELSRLQPDFLPEKVFFYMSGKNGSEDENTMELHGKVYIKKEGDNTVLYIGSANFTNSAFSVNEEILVELTFSGYDIYKKLTQNLKNDVKRVWIEYSKNNSVDTGSDSISAMSAVNSIYEYIRKNLKITNADTVSWKYTYGSLKYTGVEFTVTPLSGVSQNGTVLFKYLENDYRYAFNVSELLKKYDEEKGTETCKKFNDDLNRKIDEELKFQKQEVFRLKGSYRSHSSRKKEKNSKTLPKYEKITDPGIYELIKNIVIKYSYINDDEKRKENIRKDLKNVLSQVIADIPKDEQELADLIINTDISIKTKGEL